jgi:hypothetical protein
MTSYLLVHGGDRARARFNHPMYNHLREIIWGHEGPWEGRDVEVLNEMGLGGLRFTAKNGQLHLYLNSASERKG